MKTDQVGDGATKAIPYGRAWQTCPVCAYVRWREVLDAFDADGRVGVLRVLHQAKPFTGHACCGVDLPERGSGVTVFRGYTRPAPLRRNPSPGRR